MNVHKNAKQTPRGRERLAAMPQLRHIARARSSPCQDGATCITGIDRTVE